jgi:hypothetical protein
MRSDSLDYIGLSCPKLAHSKNIGTNTYYPYTILKRAMDELVTKDNMTVKKCMELMGSYQTEPLHAKLWNDFERMADFMRRIRNSIISIDAEVPFSIGKYPLTVYVPYILNLRKRDMLYVWLDWHNELTSIYSLLRRPSVMACYLSAKREQEIDTRMYYGTMILSGECTKKIGRPPGLVRLFEDQLESIVKGAIDEKERVQAGPHCNDCPARETCILEPGRVAAIPKDTLFTVPNEEDGRITTPYESRIRG